MIASAFIVTFPTNEGQRKESISKPSTFPVKKQN
jgi:hypothetical protein